MNDDLCLRGNTMSLEGQNFGSTLEVSQDRGMVILELDDGKWKAVLSSTYRTGTQAS
jgi:hypothetical protein